MGFVPNMRVPCTFYVNQHLQQLMFEELEQFVSRGDVGGFLPAVKQLANVAALPGARPRARAAAVLCGQLNALLVVAQALSRPPLRFRTCTADTASPSATSLRLT